jgi:phenylalanine-4-hydroxylase
MATEQLCIVEKLKISNAIITTCSEKNRFFYAIYFTISTMNIQRPTQQVYSNYTTQDFAVWKILFDRQMAILKPSASSEYLKALDIVNFANDVIPDFNVVNQLLQSLTGWKLVVVPNLCPEREFFEHLSQKKFTTTCWLRSMQQLDYIEEPDMFHDVFAHVPLLSNRDYVNFLKGLSDIALKFIDHPKIIKLLSRLYWFTIEYGLIQEGTMLKIYGAGIISSNGETLHCLSPQATYKPFDVATILSTSYRTDILQEKYFVIHSFEQLYHSLPDIREQLEVRAQLCIQ